jgi:AcrR family transcriptional regulator
MQRNHKKKEKMAKENSATKWLKTAYMLFAHEGPEGIQIERIARILGLNKSGFYHYFGTLEIFYDLLIQHHYNLTDLVVKDGQDAKNLDPDYLNIIVKHKVTFMFQMQLSRQRANQFFYTACSNVNQKIDKSIIRVWNEYLGLTTNNTLSLLFLGFVRDSFFARVSFKNFDYSFLHGMATEAKAIVTEMQDEKKPSKKFEMIKSS